MYKGRLLRIALLFILLIGCKEDPPDKPDDNWEMDPRLRQLTFYGTFGYDIPWGHASFPFLDSGNLLFLKWVHNDTSKYYYQSLFQLDTTSLKPECLLKGYYNFFAKSKFSDECLLIENIQYQYNSKLYLYKISSRSLTALNTGLDIVYGTRFTDNDSALILYGEKKVSSSSRGYYKYRRHDSVLELLILSAKGYYEFDVSPDFKHLVFFGHPAYRIYDFETGKIDTGKVYAEWFRFSPDGKRLVFSTNTLVLATPSKTGIIDLQTGAVEYLNIELITPKWGYTYVGQIEWIMDGNAICFSGVALPNQGAPGPLGPTNIYIYSLKQ